MQPEEFEVIIYIVENKAELCFTWKILLKTVILIFKKYGIVLKRSDTTDKIILSA